MRRVNDFIGLGRRRSRHGRSELFGEEGKKKKRKERKKKKNLAVGATLCPTFFGVKFVSRLQDVKCSVAIVDTDQPKSGEEPAGARRLRTGAGRREELWSAGVFMTNKWEYERDGHLGEGRFLERWLGALIGLQL